MLTATEAEIVSSEVVATRLERIEIDYKDFEFGVDLVLLKTELLGRVVNGPSTDGADHCIACLQRCNAG